MIVKWVIMAEGLTQDARGALTVVGLAQSLLATPNLPTATKRAVVMLLTGDSDEFIPGRPIKFKTSIEAPSGEMIFEHQGSVPMGPNNFPGLPSGVTIASDITFTAKEYGRYFIKMSAQPADHPRLEAGLHFYVVNPEDSYDDSSTFSDSHYSMTEQVQLW